MTGWGCDRVVVRKGKKVLLDNVSVKMQPGTMTAFLGPNGSGKTTLLRVLSGIEKPEKGVVALGAAKQWKEPDWAKNVAVVLGVVPEEIPFCVEEILLSAYFPDGGRWLDPSEFRRRPLIDLLDSLEIFPEGAAAGLDRDYATLSAGERQMVDVARGVLQKTPVLLLDEPLSALDLRHRLLVRGLLTSEAREKGRTVGLSLHDMGDVDESFDQVIVLKRGSVAGSGTPETILTPGLYSQVWGVVPEGARFRLV